jgi:glutamate synthase (NADPH/NADH) small chain
MCVLAKKMEPVAIGNLERFIADWEAQQKECVMCEMLPPTGKKVAVVGCGPAGLTVAGDMRKLGHEVTILEALHKPGGVLMYGIPEFRLPKAIVECEVNFVVSMGAELRMNYVVGKLQTIDDLLGKYDAVFVGTGAGLPWFMNLPGENAIGVYSANEYLTRSNLMKAYLFPEYDTPIVRGKQVATIGGGNVAMDSARTALRLGAEKSMIIYRRSRDEMPARAAEIHHAEEEGIDFRFLTNPVRYVTDEKGWIRELECLRMELGEPDASGRRRPVEVKGSEFRVPVDTVVVAIGNSPNPLIPQTTPGLETTKRGTLVADPKTGRTTKKGVFAGGDIVTGAATVILAMGAGRIAARSMDEYLKTGQW